MTLCQLALEDVEALYFGPSFLTADPMGPLLDQDEEEALSPSSSLEGQAPASPFLSFSPTHPSSFLGTKAGADPPPLPWLGAGDLLTAHIGADDGAGDAFAGMDWMSEKINLSEFDLDSLIGSSDEGPGSPEDLLASLDSHMDLDFDTDSPPLALEEAERPTEVDPDQQPPSPAFTLELGSEVDVPVAEQTPPPPPLSAAVIPDPGVSLLTGGPAVVSLANEDSPIASTPDCDSDSGIESVADSPARLPSPAAGSSRTKPYCRPEPSSPSPSTPWVKSVSGAPRVEKKVKKMEQNKTAATRYRQKKRVEQDLLHAECEELEKRNDALAEKAESIVREIQYLKDLMEEVRKRRGKSRA